VKLNFPDGFREAPQYFIERTTNSQSWLLFICLFKEWMQTMKDFGALLSVKHKAVPAHHLRHMGE
jgi:hypothetical protein